MEQSMLALSEPDKQVCTLLNIGSNYKEKNSWNTTNVQCFSENSQK